MLDETQKLQQKEALYPCMREEGDFASPAFTRMKKDGSSRMILNMKQLNKHIKYEHFKMESFESVLNIIRSKCLMTSVILKDAFYTVLFHLDHQKSLISKWQGHCYSFREIPNA